MLEENHGGHMAGNFSGNRLYKTLARHRWWEGMYADSLSYSKNWPECTIVSREGRVPKPPLHFPTISDCRRSHHGTAQNKVWEPICDSLVHKVATSVPSTRSEVQPHCTTPGGRDSSPVCGARSPIVRPGYQPALPSQLDVCQLLGIKKLNTTAYHPQCDGMVERFNCTAREKTSLVLSGTKLFQLLCGHTATRPMSWRERKFFPMVGDGLSQPNWGYIASDKGSCQKHLASPAEVQDAAWQAGPTTEGGLGSNKCTRPEYSHFSGIPCGILLVWTPVQEPWADVSVDREPKPRSGQWAWQ